MNDKQLLEAAAQAAGIVIDKSPYNGGGQGNTGFDVMGNAVLDWHNGRTWNPLTDDGDAFRLAVKLGLVLNLSPREDCRGQTVVTYSGFCKIEEPCHDGRDVAARRAIVRAAVALAQREDR